MQCLTCADQLPPRAENLSDHASILFMLNCYDVWSVTPPLPAEVEAGDQMNSPKEWGHPDA